MPLLYDHNSYKDIFNGSKSSVLDKKFHEKLVSINSQTSQLLENSKNDVLLQSNADIIYCFTSLAKLQQDPKVAEHLVDFCDYFIRAAQAEDAAFTKVAKTMARGTILGVRDNLRYTAQVWKKRLTDPVGSFKDELIAYKKAGEALCSALKFAVTNPKVLGEKAYEKFENIVNGAQGDPEQFFALVVSFLLPTDPVGNRLKKQFAQGLKSALKKQKKLAAKVVNKKMPKKVEQAINSFEEASKHAKRGLQKSFAKANSIRRNIEQVLPRVKTYEQARNKALIIVGNMGLGSIPWIGTMEKSVGYGKVIGRLSANKKKGWRIDWDQHKGMHINVVDFTAGKKSKALKYCIPFDGNEDTFKSLLRHLNK